VVAWLAEHGATLDIIAAWELGWKDRARELLARSPELANRRTGRWMVTPLHEAARMGDEELAGLLMTAQPDLTLRDGAFQSTPLGWAHHFGQAKIIALIEQQAAQRGFISEDEPPQGNRWQV
jgi:hypothetical protein